jgi:hypothetical protein
VHTKLPAHLKLGHATSLQTAPGSLQSPPLPPHWRYGAGPAGRVSAIRSQTKAKLSWLPLRQAWPDSARFAPSCDCMWSDTVTVTCSQDLASRAHSPQQRCQVKQLHEQGAIIHLAAAAPLMTLLQQQPLLLPPEGPPSNRHEPSCTTGC